MENIETSYACSPSALSGAFSGAHVIVAGPWKAYTQGTGLSIAMRDRTAVSQAAVKATALLPISVAVDTDGYAGIRSWSPPV